MNEWNEIKDVDGTTILEKFYADQDRYSFSFQMLAYITRLMRIKKTIEENDDDCIIITERSVFTDKNVFAKMLYDSGKIENIEYQIYIKWFDYFCKDFPLSGVIYVNTPPDVCHKRIAERQREGEDVIAVEYLRTCGTYHLAWLFEFEKKDILFLDGTIGKTDEKYKNHIDNIRSFIFDESICL